MESVFGIFTISEVQQRHTGTIWAEIKDLTLVVLGLPFFPLLTGNSGFVLFLLLAMFFPIRQRTWSVSYFLTACASAGALGIAIPPLPALAEWLVWRTPLEVSGMTNVAYSLGVCTAFFAGGIYIIAIRRTARKRIQRPL